MRAASWILVVIACVIASSLRSQSIYATHVISSDTQGGAGGGMFLPTNALGAPGGVLDVHSLGIGGSLTLGFAATIVDGPGADFLVAENPFHVTFQNTFAEVAFVEVSSNGTDFARFASAYYGPQVEPGSFGTVAVGSYENLTGQTPSAVSGNPVVDPQDVVEAGGDAFDLTDLQADPLVQQGLVDLQAITQVRLVDVQSGIDVDSRGVLIRDAGVGSADIDAVTVIHHNGNVHGNGPLVDLQVQPDGTFTLRIEDPDGWQDLDGSSLRMALFGQSLDPAQLLSGMLVIGADADGFTLLQPLPLPPELLVRLSVSVKDVAGQRSGVSRSRPLN